MALLLHITRRAVVKVTNSPEKEIKRDINTSHAIPLRGQYSTIDLAIERTVMEAVTAILESGLRVGVVLQGKKVRDDNRTLEQAGISQNGNLDNLGFTLEPRFTQVSPSSSPNKLPASSTFVADQELTRYDYPETEMDKHNENNHPSDLSPTNLTDPSTDVVIPDSRALVIVPPVNAEALAMVPLNQKLWSILELEGGVMLKCVLDNAGSPTYVDLKDKWKTLVHTASIAPQQRRGEPAPRNF
ncbi:hypothetical protein HAX54_025377 [Datura stramonium]|uniref:Telomere repeat-binding protein 1-6-like ubiquitin-like domain-containing protein n=1 Tax=Datura stramonium TaxID=4076 RepID=A0ABS8S7I7_DATST|nr:hypothetical protein [Datura stramonium]